MRLVPLVLTLLMGLAAVPACSSTESATRHAPSQPTEPQNPTRPTTALDLSRVVNEELRIPYDNAERGLRVDLYGRLVAPAGYQGHKLPLVILSPGFGNNLEFVANRYAPALARQGFVTYSLEFYGGNHGSRSGGTMLEMSPFTEVDDLTAALQHLRTLPFVDTERIFLLGFSQGGVVSAITAANHPEQVRGLVLMNAALVLFDDARAFRDSQGGIRDVNNFRGQRLGRIYFEHSLDYDIYSALPRFERETLVIQGDRDDVVPLRYAERAAQVLPSAQLEVIRGAGHIFSAAQDSQIAPILNAYLSRNSR